MNLHADLARYPFVTYFDDVQLSDGLLAGKINCVLLVTCCDMGSRLPYVCTDPKANLLIFQDLGNRSSQQGIGTLLARGDIDHLVIYGHSNCAFSRFLVQGAIAGQDRCELLARSFQAESQSAIRQYGRHLTRDEQANWRRLNEWNVLNELKYALLYPGVFERAQLSQLSMHGWLYLAETNQLSVYHPGEKQFVPAEPLITSRKELLMRRTY